MKDLSSRSKLILSVLVLLVAGVGSLLGFTDLGGSASGSSDGASASSLAPAPSSGVPKPGPPTSSAPQPSAPSSGSAVSGAAGQTAGPRGVTPVPIPPKAYDTLAEIDNGGWPDSANAPGTKGGLTWQNRGGDLPRESPSGDRITYQEWDVNPKPRGQGRDAERIVTGSDGSAWYTGDHYTSFIRMR